MSTLDADDLQYIAQITHNCSGTVWHVSTLGNDSTGRGMSWLEPLLTISRAVALAAAGDVVLVGPGTFALGTAVAAFPAGVRIIGAGMDITTITSQAILTDVGCILSASHVRDLTINAIGTPSPADEDSGYQAPWGFWVGKSSQVILPYCRIERVRMIGDTDGVFLRGDAATPAACVVDLIDVDIETKYDGIRSINSFGGGYPAWDGLYINIWGNTRVRAVGPSVIVGAVQRAIAASAGTVRIFSGHFEASGQGANGGAIFSDQAANIEVYAGATVATAAGVYDINNSSSGTVKLARGAVVNPASLNGSITTLYDSPIKLHSDWDAAKTAAQASTALSTATWTPTKAGYIDAAISTVKSQTDKITTANIVTVNPVGISNALTIVRGDSYLSADGTAITLTEGTNSGWPTDLTGYTLTFTADKDSAITGTGDSTLTATATVSPTTGTGRVVTLQLSKANTDSLAINGNGKSAYAYDIVATSGTTSRKTLFTGRLSVLEERTAIA